nr:hypothetical protein [uncultured Cellulosilyticum sp.]
MCCKKRWENPQLESLNLMKTQIDMNQSTPAGIVVDMTTEYQPPVDLSDAPQTSSNNSETAAYCFRPIS